VVGLHRMPHATGALPVSASTGVVLAAASASTTPKGKNVQVRNPIRFGRRACPLPT